MLKKYLLKAFILWVFLFSASIMQAKTGYVHKANSCANTCKLTITITGTVRLCSGSTETLTASTGAGYTYLWNTGATTSTINVTPLVNTTYSVAVTNGTCIGDTSFSIIVLPAPVLTITSTRTSICLGDAVTITATGGGTYAWSNGSTNSSINVSPAVTTTYSLSVSNGTCITDTSIKITVNTKPVAHINGFTRVCYGTGTTFTATGGQSYKWMPDSGISCDTCAVINVNINHTTTYTLVAYNGPCTDTITSKLTVDPPINGTACCNDSIKMGDSATIKVKGAVMQSYQWLPDTAISCSTCATAKVFPQFSTTYTVVMVDSNGCQKTDSVRIFVSACSTVWIPNAFAPAGGKLNSVFGPQGVCMISYTMQIYDRWGELLYTNNDSKPWDGTIHGGNVAPEDTYVYIITATDGYLKQTKYMGRVTLIK